MPAMTDYFDVNLWGIFAMPLGLILCFGPALAVWLAGELKPKARDPRSDKHR